MGSSFNNTYQPNELPNGSERAIKRPERQAGGYAPNDARDEWAAPDDEMHMFTASRCDVDALNMPKKHQYAPGKQ